VNGNLNLLLPFVPDRAPNGVLAPNGRVLPFHHQQDQAASGRTLAACCCQCRSSTGIRVGYLVCQPATRNVGRVKWRSVTTDVNARSSYAASRPSAERKASL